MFARWIGPSLSFSFAKICALTPSKEGNIIETKGDAKKQR